MSKFLRDTAIRFAHFVGGVGPRYRDRTSALAIVRFILVAGSIYAIAAALITSWSPWNRAYRSYFRTFGDVVFSQFWIWPHASVRFLDLNSPKLIDDIRSAAEPHSLPDAFGVPGRDPIKDTLLVLKNTSADHPGIGLLRTSSRPIGYWPTAFIVALTLTTPWVWRRRIWVFVWGLAAVHVFMAVRLSVFLLKGGFADSAKRFRLFECSEFWFGKLKSIDEILNDDPGTNFIAPLIIWFAVLLGLDLGRFVREKLAAGLKAQAPRRARRRDF